MQICKNSYLFSNDDYLPLWGNCNYNAKKIINDLYKLHGDQVNLFFISLASKMYGDLLSVYKMSIVKRQLVDKNRITRRCISDIDSSGHRIFMGKFFKLD